MAEENYPPTLKQVKEQTRLLQYIAHKEKTGGNWSLLKQVKEIEIYNEQVTISILQSKDFKKSDDDELFKSSLYKSQKVISESKAYLKLLDQIFSADNRSLFIAAKLKCLKDLETLYEELESAMKAKLEFLRGIDEKLKEEKLNVFDDKLYIVKSKIKFRHTVDTITSEVDVYKKSILKTSALHYTAHQIAQYARMPTADFKLFIDYLNSFVF